MIRTNLLAMIIAFPTIVSAQTMSPQYDMYTSYAYDGTNVSQTVLVEGTTSATGCYYQCGYRGQNTCELPGCSQGVHTPTIVNRIGSVGGTTIGPGQSPFSYMSFQTTTVMPMAVGDQANGDAEVSVGCSFLGIIFQNGGLVNIRVWTTKVDWIGGKIGSVCATTANCFGGIVPFCPVPGVNVGLPDVACSPGWLVQGIAVRVGSSGGYTCFPGFSAPVNQGPGLCTPP